MIRRALVTPSRTLIANQAARSFSKAVGRRTPREAGMMTSPTRSSLFGGPLSRLMDEMSHDLFRDPFFSPALRRVEEIGAGAMNLDVSETDKQYVVRAELPGIKKEDVKVTFDNHVLTITSERKEEKTHEEETKHYSDFVYGKVARSIRIPEAADADSVQANMVDGVLTITLNKAETHPGKTIEIK